MNTTQTFVAVLIITAGTAFSATAAHAADADPGYPQPYTSTVSRAEVLQQTQIARAQGQLRHGELPLAASDFMASKTRVQVRAETQAAIRLGLIPSGEGSPVYSPAQLDRIRMAGQRAAGTPVASL